MELVNLLLPGTNKFASGYYEGINEIKPFFHYEYQRLDEYMKRLKELRTRSFKRKDLANTIAQFMQPYPTSEKVRESIEKLKREDSVVIIGGQQAGLLTGPLYSIHKVISIIALAKEKEKELNVPVVPIFWIAGEDHDFAEINHIYIHTNNELKKSVYPEKTFNPKKMISDYKLDKEVCMNWIHEIMGVLGETEYSKDLLAFLENSIHASETYVDFFAYIIMELFKDEGILLFDSGNRQFRQLEKEIFIEEIRRSKDITAAVLEQQQLLISQGFNHTIDMSPTGANLFYYDEKLKQRNLLEHSTEGDGYFSKDGDFHFSYEELLAIAENSPHLLSNNVVTRPITQELLFPTLAFIAGPGEISYWAELKKAFELFGIKMPPIVPRINITFLEREIESDLTALQIDLHHALKDGVEDERQAFISTLKEKNYIDLFSQLRSSVDLTYKDLEVRVMADFRGLLPVVYKNKKFIEEQFHYLEKKIEEAILLQHDVRIKQYDRIENCLRPLNGPQERVWNILYFLNRYGLHFINDVMKLKFQFDGHHKVIKL